MTRRSLFSLVILITLGIAGSGCWGGNGHNVLVFSKTAGYRHASIPDAHAAIGDIARSIGAHVDSTEDSSVFTDDVLDDYDLVIFALTTGDVLDDAQQEAFKRFIQRGGGYVGIHSASDTEYDWPWYGELVGGYFDGHPNDPNVRPGRLIVEDPYHPSTSHLPFHWDRTDEWYDIKNRNPNVKLLISAVDSSYKEEWTEATHPVAWYHVYDGGRAFYTALGHTSESFHEAKFVKHLRGGIEYALGIKRPTEGPPRESSFSREVLVDSLTEPMELEVLPDGRVLFIQRTGQIMLYDHESGLAEAGSLNVDLRGEDGLLGMAIDPSFDEHPRLYLYYSPIDTAVNRLSRFEFDGDVVLPSSEIVMLEVPVIRGCCHSGSSIEFDRDGNLYLSTGDDTNPFESDGHSPHDERPDREVFNAQRSAANTADLRGKILRIKPEEDGSYSIPPGNLTDKYDIDGRPEIYTMGHRNPFRISVDPKNGFMYWGDVGPDANEDTERGPMGYDEIGQAREAGNFGWPYVIADNQPYRHFDFATNELGEWFDPGNLVNESRLNTGSRELPPARPAMIWYPYIDSKDFPMVGNGGRTSMAGPVYYSDLYRKSGERFPAFFDGKLFIFDWMRNWIKFVTFDRHGTLLRIESFMPSEPFNRPTDMVFSPDGVMYLLEYGTKWASQNPEARLSRIAHQGD